MLRLGGLVKEESCDTSLKRVALKLQTAITNGLQQLNFNYCLLNEIPDLLLTSNYCRSSVTHLYLKSNSITSLSPAIGHLQALTELYLYANKLKEIPHEVTLLPHLVTLNVACNEVTTVTCAIGCMVNLRVLNVTKNFISLFPDSLWKAPSLQQLLASDNKLVEISSDIVHCQTLEKLILDHNQLSFLPPQITKMKNMTELTFCGNSIATLPSDFSDLPQLRTLYMDNNPGISFIPFSLSLPCLNIGLEGCSVSFSKNYSQAAVAVEHDVIPISVPTEPLPPLQELSARALHHFLKEAITSPLLWLPLQLCPLLPLPSHMSDLLFPAGRCSLNDCQKEFFIHHYVYAVCSSKLNIRTNLSDVMIHVEFCSRECVREFWPEVCM